MKVTVVVLNFNGRKYIAKCLDSLLKLQTLDIKVDVVVVDNLSSDDSVVFIRKSYSQVTLIENSKNLGYAEGNNVGIRFAKSKGADFVWIVNPDVYVAPEALAKLVEFAQKHPRAGILGSKIYFAPGYEFHKERYKKAEMGKVLWYAGGKMDWDNVYAVHVGMNEVDQHQFDVPQRVELVTGASMLLRTTMLDQIELIDSKYYLYYEENDLCQRAKQAGWELWYVPQSVVWHANAQATGVGSALVDYYTTRSRLLFGMRWAPKRAKLALFRESVRHLISGRSWQRRGVIDFYLGRFGMGSYR